MIYHPSVYYRSFTVDAIVVALNVSAFTLLQYSCEQIVSNTVKDNVETV